MGRVEDVVTDVYEHRSRRIRGGYAELRTNLAVVLPEVCQSYWNRWQPQAGTELAALRGEKQISNLR